MKNISYRVMAALVLSALAVRSAPAGAATFMEQCPDIAACAKVVSELLGQKYVFDADVKGSIRSTPNVELTKENAELIFTNVLNMNGFSRVPLASPGLYQIMRQRDARDSAIPTVNCDAQTAPNLPDTWDLLTLKYKAAHPQIVEHIARFARSFMPANSRIIPVEFSGMLLVTDTAPNLKKLYDLLKSNDVKPTAAMLKKWDEQEKAWEKRKLLEAAQPQPPKPQHDEQQAKAAPPVSTSATPAPH